MYDNMMCPGTPISINYSDERLRILVEEFITQQRSTFTLKGVCDYVLFWAMESGHTTGTDAMLYESDQLAPADCERVSQVLERIEREGRIAHVGGDAYSKTVY